MLKSSQKNNLLAFHRQSASHLTIILCFTFCVSTIYQMGRYAGSGRQCFRNP